MRAGRATIYLPGPVAAYLDDREEGLSGRLAAIVLRYQHMVRADAPALTRDQWCAVCDACNGLDDLLAEHPAALGTMLWSCVADAEGLAERWGVDRDGLVRHMRGWTYGQTVAAYEVVRGFWRRAGQHPGEDTQEALRAAGARLVDAQGAAG